MWSQRSSPVFGDALHDYEEPQPLYSPTSEFDYAAEAYVANIVPVGSERRELAAPTKPAAGDGESTLNYRHQRNNIWSCYAPPESPYVTQSYSRPSAYDFGSARRGTGLTGPKAQDVHLASIEGADAKHGHHSSVRVSPSPPLGYNMSLYYPSSVLHSFQEANLQSAPFYTESYASSLPVGSSSTSNYSEDSSLEWSRRGSNSDSLNSSQEVQDLSLSDPLPKGLDYILPTFKSDYDYAFYDSWVTNESQVSSSDDGSHTVVPQPANLPTSSSDLADSYRLHCLSTLPTRESQAATQQSRSPPTPRIYDEEDGSGALRRRSPALLSSDGAGPVDNGRSMLQCGRCKTTFTGYYAYGNRARHMKHMHTGANDMMDLTCHSCGQIFRRKDARKKHERNKHAAGPEPARRGPQSGRRMLGTCS